jgi:hypothetical protein
VELEISRNNGSTFVGLLQIENRGVALPTWSLRWDFGAGEQLTGIFLNANGGLGSNASVTGIGPIGAQVSGAGSNTSFRAGDSLRSPIWITGTWTSESKKITKPRIFTLNGQKCLVNVHGTRFDK